MKLTPMQDDEEKGIALYFLICAVLIALGAFCKFFMDLGAV